MSGYHVIDIKKHSHLSPLKLVEESLEFADALASGNRIMAMVELSDLYGAVIAQAEKLEVTPEELATMSKCTKNAFVTGGRPSFGSIRDWKKYIENYGHNHSVHSGCVQVWVDHYTYFLIFTDGTTMPMQNDVDLQSNSLCEVIQGVVRYSDKTYLAGNLFHRGTNEAFHVDKGSLIRVQRFLKPVKNEHHESKIEEALKCL